MHFYGTHFVDIDGELAQLDTDGYRPLRLAPGQRGKQLTGGWALEEHDERDHVWLQDRGVCQAGATRRWWRRWPSSMRRLPV
ncbi:hypothetical protein ACLQ3F_29675 [Micromonospora sp. DT15]|uniref:hypothetical protein n=1 Tax=Micromonospora sp. DT15 TaxID=3393445 RepID=UPI003CEA1BE4